MDSYYFLLLIKVGFFFDFLFLIIKDKILKMSSIPVQYLNDSKIIKTMTAIFFCWFKLAVFTSLGFSLFGCCIILYFLNLPFVAGWAFESNLEDSEVLFTEDFSRPAQHHTSTVHLCRTMIPWQNWIISKLKVYFSGMMNS